MQYPAPHNAHEIAHEPASNEQRQRHCELHARRDRSCARCGGSRCSGARLWRRPRGQRRRRHSSACTATLPLATLAYCCARYAFDCSNPDWHRLHSSTSAWSTSSATGGGMCGTGSVRASSAAQSMSSSQFALRTWVAPPLLPSRATGSGVRSPATSSDGAPAGTAAADRVGTPPVWLRMLDSMTASSLSPLGSSAPPAAPLASTCAAAISVPKGVSPVSISTSRTPSAHQSTGAPCFALRTSSGAWYSVVPTLTWSSHSEKTERERSDHTWAPRGVAATRARRTMGHARRPERRKRLRLQGNMARVCISC
eukprot:scaffold1150_cov135-Isochrysis_galbana.AAC.5